MLSMMILFMSEKVLLSSFNFVLESIILILAWFKEIRQPEDYGASLLGKSYYDASLMRIQSIGETLKKIDKENPGLLNKYAYSKWNEIIRIREIISHHYEQIDQEIIFDICKNDLPVLKTVIERIIADLKKQS